MTLLSVVLVTVSVSTLSDLASSSCCFLGVSALDLSALAKLSAFDVVRDQKSFLRIFCFSASESRSFDIGVGCGDCCG